MSETKKIEVINIGDELLLGIRENTHLTYIGSQLRRYGLSIERSVIVRDTVEEIQKAFQEAWGRSDVIITTGGLGPTSDDMTREVISKCLGEKLIFDEEVKATIEERFEKLGKDMTPNNLKLCYKPENGELLNNPYGTAPGIKFKKDGKVLYMLPGPTREMQPMFTKEVVFSLKEEDSLLKGEHYVQIRTTGIGESSLEELLNPVFEKYPQLNTAFCAYRGMVDVRLTSSDVEKLDQEALSDIGDECRELLGEDFVCFGHATMAEIIASRLRMSDTTLAIAESCTGGLLSSAFTDIPGISEVFKGGVVSYCDEAKIHMLGIPEDLIQQHSTVSEVVAIAMATGAAEKLDADFGMSVTGFLGPTGGSRNNPVGTVFIGFHSREGAWAKRIVLPGERLVVKERTVNSALDWMRRYLDHYRLSVLLDTVQEEEIIL